MAKNENGRREWKTSVSCKVFSVLQDSLSAISLGRDAVSSCESKRQAVTIYCKDHCNGGCSLCFSWVKAVPCVAGSNH